MKSVFFKKYSLLRYQKPKCYCRFSENWYHNCVYYKEVSILEDNLQKFEKFEKFIQASDMLSDKINEADQFLISACGGNSEGVFFEINGNHALLVDAITFIIESMVGFV